MTPGLMTRVVLARPILFQPAGRAVLFRIYAAPSGGPMASRCWWWWMSRARHRCRRRPSPTSAPAKVIVAPNRLAPGELNAASVSDLPWIHQVGRRPCVSSRRVSHRRPGRDSASGSSSSRPARSGLHASAFSSQKFSPPNLCFFFCTCVWNTKCS